MAELEDAEAEMAEQERWGLGRVGLAVKRLLVAVRVLRNRSVAHDQRLDAIEARLDDAGIPRR
jgi:hypothetical protein